MPYRPCTVDIDFYVGLVIAQRLERLAHPGPGRHHEIEPLLRRLGRGPQVGEYIFFRLTRQPLHRVFQCGGVEDTGNQ
ncbi:MAG: hypothetical protein R3E50_01900 [Halioglobus sp.]